jgi:hypothetical protein
MSTSDQLQQAFRLIRDGNKTQAAAILVPIVRAEPNNADAWWLLANAVSGTDQQRRALEQVLRLRPNDDKARRMLDQIGGGGFPASPPMQPPDPWATQPPPSTAFGGDPFAHVGAGQSAPYYPQPRAGGMQSAPPIAPQRKGTNPCVIILAIIGFVVVVGCAACVLLSGGTIGTFVSGFLGTLTADPDLANTFGTAIANITPEASNLGSRLSGNFTDRGPIQRGQTLNASVDSQVDDGWTYNGNSGESITIEVRALDSSLDPELFLYDPERIMIEENDDVNLLQGDLNSRISVTLPASGKYTIIVSAYGGEGDYEISVS